MQSTSAKTSRFWETNIRKSKIRVFWLFASFFVDRRRRKIIKMVALKKNSRQPICVKTAIGFPGPFTDRAVSSVKCNTSNEILLELREDFVGRLEAEDFARAVVQGMLNGSEFLMRDVAQVHTFG